MFISFCIIIKKLQAKHNYKLHVIIFLEIESRSVYLKYAISKLIFIFTNLKFNTILIGINLINKMLEMNMKRSHLTYEKNII